MNKKLYVIANRAFHLGLDASARVLPWPKAKQYVGPGCRKEIPRILKEYGVTKVMVVTGQTTGELAAPIIEDIKKAGIAVAHYNKVKPNPTTDIVYEIRDMYEREGCNGFLPIGGGSPMDASKAAACLICWPKRDIYSFRGLLKNIKKIPPFIAVPTTAGTGSETTMASVITNSKDHHKFVIMDNGLIPKVAVMDPELLASLPADLTATTGMDALTHALESYISWANQTKDSIEFAEAATVLIFKYLEKTYNNPNDLDARAHMMEAAYKAGWSFGRTGVGYVHAIAHTLGGLYDIGHGYANSVILPIVLEDYGPAVYDKLAHLALLTGVKTDGTNEERAKAFIAEIYAMNERMGIPKGIEINATDIDQMVEWAMSESIPMYPVPVVYDEARFRKVIDIIRSRA